MYRTYRMTIKFPSGLRISHEVQVDVFSVGNTTVWDQFSELAKGMGGELTWFEKLDD